MSLYQYSQEEFNLFEKNKKLLIAKIKAIPDNSNITKINNHCFTISIGQLNSNWSAFYHDFEQQRNKLIEIIENSENMKSIYSKLRDIIDKKSFYDKGCTCSFNEKVIEKLKELL